MRALLNHLTTHTEPLSLRRGKPGQLFSDWSLHAEYFLRDPEMYALLALVPDIQPWQRARILLQLLYSSRKGMEDELRRSLDQVIVVLLAVLAVDHVIAVALALRQLRANHKHTSRSIVRYFFGHPLREHVMKVRRSAVVDCIEHALGKNVARASRNYSRETEDKLCKYLRRYGVDAGTGISVLRDLYEKAVENEAAIIPGEEPSSYRLAHIGAAARLDNLNERPKTITPTNRGEASSALVHIYRGGSSPELCNALEQYVEDAAKSLPEFHGKLALIVDASASSKSYGEREFSTLSQAVALQYILERLCSQLELHTVGGTGRPPVPQGATDLALPLLVALEYEPDLVLIVSDGYENTFFGDLERILAALPVVGIKTPVIVLQSKFTSSDDLTLRRPSHTAPQLEFWHQQDFEKLLLSAYLHCDSGVNSARLFLRRKLDNFCCELQRAEEQIVDAVIG